MLPRTRRYCRHRGVSGYWTRPPTPWNTPSSLVVSRHTQMSWKSQNCLEMRDLQNQRRLGSPTVFVSLSTHLQTRAQGLSGRLEMVVRIQHEADCMPLYTPLRQANLASLHNAHPNTIPTCQIGQLSAGPRSPQQKVAPQLSVAATRQIQPPRLSMKARRSYHRQPRGAQPAIRNEAPLTTPMDLPWSTQTIRKTQQ